MEDRNVRGKPGKGGFAPADKHPQPAACRKIPDPLPLRTMFGPGLVMTGVGLASAEFILWPYMTSRVVPAFLWVAVVAVLTQFFVNTEVARYTLATGQSAVTGFRRLWKPWALIFAAVAICANAWPAWAVGSATAVTLAYDVGEGPFSPSRFSRWS
ncbi:Nramp family divalent metal transporter [Rubrobacter indicoceani]|uniref:Nramp family divalent metal transporter n=1 Tax=Rubrobacter indicoceani TaxID=2051957 RepID=UPI0013C4504E|nr:Nramp family divalent metal transporter [Rubrobacter indicoceani]